MGKNRKQLFLSTTILRGRLLKDDGEDGGAIEVGAGFGAPDNTEPPANKGDGDEGHDDGSSDNQSENQDVDDQGQSGDGGDADGDGDGEDGSDDDDGKPKKRNTAEYIRDLKKQLREERQKNSTFEQRLENLEKGGLRPDSENDNSQPTREKPDHTDTAKYPLGVLDDGFIQDMIEYTADVKTAEALDAVLRREREKAQQSEAEQAVAKLREKVDTVSAKGSEIFEDYEETVVEAGLRGDYPLTQVTFEAAADADHGAEILYSLANDKAEALRVAQMTPFEQLKYVAQKDGEIAAKRSARKVPKAGEPPKNLPRGANASSQIRGDTESLEDFGKAWDAHRG